MKLEQEPQQLRLRLSDPPTVDVDGRIDSRGIQYIGRATQQFDGSWRALANVAGCLCLVEVTITFKDPS